MTTIYEQAGGDTVFHALVEAFYRRIEADPRLHPMFPADREPGKRHQYLFLRQVFGGPQDYAALRGHPRLRLRHMPFPIGDAEARAWLEHMLDAMDEVGIPEPPRGEMRAYFERAAAHMVNLVSP